MNEAYGTQMNTVGTPWVLHGVTKALCHKLLAEKIANHNRLKEAIDQKYQQVKQMDEQYEVLKRQLSLDGKPTTEMLKLLKTRVKNPQKKEILIGFHGKMRVILVDVDNCPRIEMPMPKTLTAHLDERDRVIAERQALENEKQSLFSQIHDAEDKITEVFQDAIFWQQAEAILKKMDKKTLAKLKEIVA